ncbi:MAG: hypothetical protein NT038_00385 [Euryarchaeota archaeon]|nr:hypothetical protein [Euryarchaeota archaeon]
MSQRKSLQYKLLSVCSILLLVSCLFVPSILTSSPTDIAQPSAYGFFIPMPQTNDYENQYEQKEQMNTVMNLINDLLRLHIPVYWSSTDLTILSKEIKRTAPPEKSLFPRGTFIVPFTGDNCYDKQLISLIYDYNVSHELTKYWKPQVPIFMILEPIQKMDGYELAEPRIAYYYGKGISHENWYFDDLTKAGCLSNVFLDEAQILTQLTNRDFNIFIWGGGSLNHHVSNSIYTSSRILSLYKIKQFIVNGGGYLGSCYGAASASSGLRFLPMFLPAHYLPRLPTIGCLGLGDFLVSQSFPADINITIEKSDSPVLFGVNGTIKGSALVGAPVVTWYGKQTESLATVKDVDLTDRAWYAYLFPRFYSLPEPLIQHWVDFTQGKTIWTSSQCKKGKVVTFCDHPEEGDAKELRVLYNALFYVTSHQIHQIDFLKIKNILDIETTGEDSLNLVIEDFSSSTFLDVKNKIKETTQTYRELNDKYNYLEKVLFNLTDTGKMNNDFAYQIGYDGFWKSEWLVWECLQYLDFAWSENITDYVEQLDSISHMLVLKNVPIEKSITQIQKEIICKLTDSNTRLSQLSMYLDELKDELENYTNTTRQNNVIIKDCNKIDATSKQLYRDIPVLYFDILKVLRESWYTYEALAV